MKEIGEKLKEARESIGIPIEEAGADLKVSVDQLKNLEAGNMDVFKDIINVKYLIRDYAKYLGLDKEDLVDDFNEYLFDYTSKISINDILDAKAKKDDNRIKSPYTTIKVKKPINIPLLIVIILIVLCLSIVVYQQIVTLNKENVISYVEGK